MGANFCVLNSDETAQNIQSLRTISDDWLENKGHKERGFSLGNFCGDYIKKLPIAVVKINDEIIAFANLLSSENPKTLGIDSVSYTHLDVYKRQSSC